MSGIPLLLSVLLIVVPLAWGQQSVPPPSDRLIPGRIESLRARMNQLHLGDRPVIYDLDLKISQSLVAGQAGQARTLWDGSTLILSKAKPGSIYVGERGFGFSVICRKGSDGEIKGYSYLSRSPTLHGHVANYNGRQLFAVTTLTPEDFDEARSQFGLGTLLSSSQSGRIISVKSIDGMREYQEINLATFSMSLYWPDVREGFTITFVMSGVDPRVLGQTEIHPDPDKLIRERKIILVDGPLGGGE